MLDIVVGVYYILSFMGDVVIEWRYINYFGTSYFLIAYYTLRLPSLMIGVLGIFAAM